MTSRIVAVAALALSVAITATLVATRPQLDPGESEPVAPAVTDGARVNVIEAQAAPRRAMPGP